MKSPCGANTVGIECADSGILKGFCRYHWRQKKENRTLTIRRYVRPRGSAVVRDAAGHKQCARCEKWKPESLYTPASKTRDGLQSWCSDCASDYMMIGRYGFARSEVEAMVAAQGGCAICGVVNPTHKGFRNGWHVDHDHSCCPGDRTCRKCIRSILCSQCNKLIGLANDDVVLMRKAISYLLTHNEMAHQERRHP